MTPDYLLLLLFGLLAVAAACLAIWYFYQSHLSKENLQVDAPIFRGRSIIHHWSLGTFEATAYLKESMTYVRFEGIGVDGDKISWMGHAHQLIPRDPIQAAYGPGPAEWDFIPDIHERSLVAHMGELDRRTHKLTQFKEAAMNANADAKLAAAQQETRIDRAVEQLQNMSRSTQAQQNKGAKR